MLEKNMYAVKRIYNIPLETHRDKITTKCLHIDSIKKNYASSWNYLSVKYVPSIHALSTEDAKAVYSFIYKNVLRATFNSISFSRIVASIFNERTNTHNVFHRVQEVYTRSTNNNQQETSETKYRRFLRENEHR